MGRLVTMFVLLASLAACARNNVEPTLSPSSGHEEAATEEGGHESTEGGEGHDNKKPDEKPKPDSVISSVLSLPIVKKWSEWMDSKSNGSKIVAWGEYVKVVHGSKCWSIVVAEESDRGRTIWKRFCMQQTGLEMWVETMLDAKSEYETNYITYDNWMNKCSPAYNSPGTC